MSGIVHTSHEQPVSVTVKDFLVQGWVEPSVGTDGSPGGQSWTIELGGTRYPGPPVDLTRDASLHDVKEMLRQWAREHPELFS